MTTTLRSGSRRVLLGGQVKLPIPRAGTRWSAPALRALEGKTITVRYDPVALTASVEVEGQSVELVRVAHRT